MCYYFARIKENTKATFGIGTGTYKTIWQFKPSIYSWSRRNLKNVTDMMSIASLKHLKYLYSTHFFNIFS